MSDEVNIQAIFCDDIRQEINGKQILIGVYTGDLVPGAPFPHAISLAVWLRIRGLTPGDHPFEVKLVDPQGVEALAIEDKFKVGPPEPEVALLAFTGVPVRLEQVGKVRVLLGLDGHDIAEIGHIEVREPSLPIS